MTTQELRDKREGLIQQADALAGPERSFKSLEDRAAFDAIMADIAALEPQIEDAVRADKLAGLQRELSLPESQRTTEVEERQEREQPEKAAQRKQYRNAMLDYIRNGVAAMAHESRMVLQRGYRVFDAEERTMSAIGGAAGGFTVMPDMRFASLIQQAQLFFGGMEAAGAQVITTDTGADLPFLTNDDTSNTGSIIAESGSHASGTDLSFGGKVLKSFLYSTKIVLVPWQLLQDTAIDLEGYLAAAFGVRLGRIQNTHFTTGTGANQPEGLFQNITVGRQAATGNATSFPFDDVYRMVHSVDVAYRGANCKWMMKDATILDLRLAKDGQGRYLWPELSNTQVGQPLSLAGYPVVVNNDVATMAASAKAASFGDHSAYKIRRVNGYTFVRLDQLYAASGQVGFLAFQRADGGYISTGNPVKAFQNSAA